MPLYITDAAGNTVAVTPGTTTAPSGGADKQYTHNQSAAAATWNITHNLGKHPSVSIVDSAGTQVFGGVTYVDANQLTLTFSVPFSGKAYLN